MAIVILSVVPTPASDSIEKVSEFFLMLGRPMPAPNPSSRISAVAVEYPSRIASSMSGMPGPRSSTWMEIVSEAQVLDSWVNYTLNEDLDAAEISVEMSLFSVHLQGQ